jgi:hypothetical protein
MTKKTLIFLLLLGLPGLLAAQQLTLKSVLQFDDMDFFSTDHLGNIYIVSQDEIRLVNQQGGFVTSYSDPIQGKIKSIDTFNPMRILMQHAAFFSVSFLDNMLNPVAQVLEPAQFGFLDVQLVSNVDQNQIWMFDQSLDRIIKWDVDQGREVARSLTITQLLQKELQPAKLLSRIDGVYLLIPGYGVLVFDQFGGFKRQILLPEIGFDLQVRNKTLVYTANGQLFKMQLDTFETSALTLPGKPTQVRLEGRTLYCREGNQLYIYELN